MADFDYNTSSWINGIVDLTKQNHLVNYREEKMQNITITTPRLVELFGKLCIQEATFSFDGLEIIKRSNGRFVLTTNSGKIDQINTLINLKDKNENWFNDHDEHILYLVMGFINWKDSKESNERLISPLILVPVDLLITTAQESFYLKKSPLPVIVNPVLQYKLSQLYQVTLPSFNYKKDNISKYLSTIEKLILKDNWTLSYDCAVGLFPDKNIPTFEFYKNSTTSVLEAPFLTATNTTTDSTNPAIDPLSSPEPLSPPILIQDADEVQLEAIRYARQGNSFILNGAMGTGKTQTLINIMANALADKKNVLYINNQSKKLCAIYKVLSECGMHNTALVAAYKEVRCPTVTDSIVNLLSSATSPQEDEPATEIKNRFAEKLMQNDYLTNVRKTPLSVTLNEVISRINYYSKNKLIQIDFNNLLDTTEDMLKEYTSFIGESYDFITNNKTVITHNSWASCNTNSHDLDYDQILLTCSDLHTSLVKIYEIISAVNNSCNFYDRLNIDRARGIQDLFSTFSSSRSFPTAWLSISDFSDIAIRLKECITLQIQLAWAKQNDTFIKDLNVYEIEADELITSIESKCESIRKLLSDSHQTDEVIVKDSDKIILSLKIVQSAFNKALGHINYIASVLGIQNIRTIDSFILVQSFIYELIHNPSFVKFYFDNVQTSRGDTFIKEASLTFSTIATDEGILLNTFQPSILSIDYKGMLSRFKNEYSGRLLFLNKNYKEDKRLFTNAMLSPNTPVTDELILSTLATLEKIGKNKQWVAENEWLLKESFGAYYERENTDWNAIKLQIEMFDKVYNLFDDKVIPSQLKTYLDSSALDNHLLQPTISESLREAAKRLSTDLIAVDYKDKDLLQLNKSLTYIISILTKIKADYQTIKSFHVEDTPYPVMLKNLLDIASTKDSYQRFCDNEVIIKDICGEFYDGTNTVFSDILSRVEFANAFTKLYRKHRYDDSFLRRLCNKDDFIGISVKATPTVKSLPSLMAEHDHIVARYKSMFTDTESLLSHTFDYIINNLSERLRNKDELLSLVQNNNITKKANLYNLTKYIGYIKRGEYKDISSCIGSFLHSFYFAYLNALKESDKAVLEYTSKNGADRSRVIVNARKAQRQLYLTNGQRINSTHVKDISRAISNGVFKKEIAYVKSNLVGNSVLTTQQSFEKIPLLVSSGFPCMLMTPPSATDLITDAYSFDMVILDDASNLPAYTALYLALKGTQVIISGDTNLPLFQREINLKSSISPLNISALTLLNSKLSHKNLSVCYSHTHEDMVKFASSRFYHNSLTIFPYFDMQSTNLGITAHQVTAGTLSPDGVNTNETANVLQKILWCYWNFPNKTLGIVTLLESQAQELMTQILILCEQDSSLEYLFSASKDEPFFIRPIHKLEDTRRDIIIFATSLSKHYSKTTDMDTPPLNSPDLLGFVNNLVLCPRNLLHIVTSLSTEGTTNERNEGISAIKELIHCTTEKNPSVAFTYHQDISASNLYKSVGSYILSLGYGVKYLYGDSSLKLPIVVYDRKQPLINLLAIIFDDDNMLNHNSQMTSCDTLSDIGWSVHRMWGYDWVADNRRERNRLFTAIKVAQIKVKKNLEDRPTKKQRVVVINPDLQSQYQPDKKSNSNISEPPTPISVSTESIYSPTSDTLGTADLIKKLGLLIYEQVDVNELVIPGIPIEQNIKACVSTLVSKEYPILFDHLCKRVCVAVGEPKVSIRFKALIQKVIQENLSSQMYIHDDFYYLKSDDPLPVRVPSTGSDTRPIQYISKNELAQAIQRLYQNNPSITVSELQKDTANLFGFIKMGSKIKYAIQDAFNLFIQNNGYIVNGDSIIPPS